MDRWWNLMFISIVFNEVSSNGDSTCVSVRINIISIENGPLNKKVIYFTSMT